MAKLAFSQGLGILEDGGLLAPQELWPCLILLILILKKCFTLNSKDSGGHSKQEARSSCQRETHGPFEKAVCSKRFSARVPWPGFSTWASCAYRRGDRRYFLSSFKSGISQHFYYQGTLLLSYYNTPPVCKPLLNKCPELVK